MIRKILIIVLINLNLYSTYPVTDVMSYQYMISGIKQTTEMINGITKQIQSLGGIRSSIDEMKTTINDTKNDLQGSLNSLERARKNLQNTVHNVEIKSLFDMNKTSGTRGGILYEDISKIFNDAYKEADNAFIRSIGGKEKLDDFLKSQYKLIDIVNANSWQDFQSAMNGGEPINIAEKKRQILVKDYVEETKKLDTESKKYIAAELINREWKSTFFPVTDEELEKIDKRTERLKELSEFIEKSSDVKQSIKTTNMILLEMLQLLQQDFNSALHFRNAMVSTFLDKKKGVGIALELKERAEELRKLKLGDLPKAYKDSKLSKMKGANPYGIGWRPM